MKIHALIIDPQIDFCSPSGSLYVKGADEDMKRLAAMVRRLAPKIDDIHVTLDSHRLVDISHPLWWKDAAGNSPAPFTMISAADLKSGRWETRLPSCHARSLVYLQTLEKGARYPHIIWPEHCIIGDTGHNVYPDLAAAIHEWERARFALADFVTKGSNPWTEHFSAVKAEVPDPEDPGTQVNTRLIQTLEEADIILLAGEALSHCLLSTVEDIAANFSDAKYIQKMILLTDASSSVGDPPGTTLFTDRAAQFLREMTAKGMKTDTTVDFLR
jgi:nicotinamidase-related amidase